MNENLKLINSAIHNLWNILVRRGGLEPPRAFAQRIFLPSTAFAAAFKAFVVWTIPSPYPGWVRYLGAARLVSTPSLQKGLARDCHVKGFPEFEQFCILGFPQEHSKI